MTETRQSNTGKWKERRPADRAWKPRKGTSARAEQDRAAGGRHRRMMDLGDGRYACASVTLRLQSNTRRIRAVLRWSDRGKSPERYLGEVDLPTRAENLAAAWHMAHEAGLGIERPPEGSWASSQAARAVMRANRSKDTKPELRLRSLLHGRGLRYRVQFQPLAQLRRNADVAFPREKVAVFVDGCFWHGCPEHYRPASKNAVFWREKIEANQLRDAATTNALAEAGWAVVRVWEHEDVAEACELIVRTVHQRRAALKAPTADRSQGIAIH